MVSLLCSTFLFIPDFLLNSFFWFIDIAHSKDIKEMTGVSVRTIFLNIFFQLFIFLYLMDNNQDTSWMILIGQGVGLAIEVWKVKKAVDVEVSFNGMNV